MLEVEEFWPSINGDLSQVTVNLSIYQFINLSIHQSINLPICQSINLSIWQSTTLSIYQSINLSIYQSINLSIYQSINLSIYQYIYISVSIYLSIYLTQYLCIYLSLSGRYLTSLILPVGLFRNENQINYANHLFWSSSIGAQTPNMDLEIYYMWKQVLRGSLDLQMRNI